ncbi:MAG: anhydro-N-acetylmuramic acid kinase [Bacteroidota bacterium]
MKTYYGLGIMSGTSMDGLDLAYCRFDVEGDQYQFSLEASRAIPFDERWRRRLSLLMEQRAEIYAKTHVYFGHFIGTSVQAFLEEEKLAPDFVACHGQTIFHQPDKNFTAQIGDGETIVSYLNCPLVTNFRNKDVALGGQGAPLIPLVEELLFPEYKLFLNLGGFSNLAYQGTAFDVSSANGILNYLYSRALPDAPTMYDPSGELSASGHVYEPLLQALNELDYYQLSPPKSLGWEWVEQALIPVLGSFEIPLADQLHTLVVHQAQQIAKGVAILNCGSQEILVTGGGRHHHFMMQKLEEALTPLGISLAHTSDEVVDYKEAIGFGLLGLRTLLGKSTIQAGATGAPYAAVTGAIHLPPKWEKAFLD